MIRYLLQDTARLQRITLALGASLLCTVFFLLNQNPAAWAVLPGLAPWAEAAPTLMRLATAAVLTALVMLNIRLLGFLSRGAQILGVWLELFALLMLFFWSFDLSFSFIAKKIGFLVSQGVVTTLYISALSIVIATVIALIGAVAKMSKNGVIYGLASFYTSLFRGLPLLMQIYIIYLGLPQVGYVVGAIPAGILALSLCYGAYMTEIFRAGIESIARGQTEGAKALALSPAQSMVLVILPQAMRIIIPPTGNQFIAMLKDSSLVSVVGVWELMYLARTQGQTEFRHIEMLITASMIYWLLSVGLELAQARIEKRFGRSNAR
ncbi:amino acid ABC transporter permease [Cereibacter changlensis]|uniref:Glutamate/aspartate import permease protein GltK n=2 Tax=Cereibacter changlensis TaxID=402884 RepID=A0A2T4JTW8_9RHOB|nr:amino acid ABC transporter permease [Cereibacter changlensis]PTE21360.1 amino acid ABC transporter permease [Cereibacter changlensis JA139]PZX56456.1 polar amino acid transport system permease protein [Cereibacter changlensis]TKA98027.1 amino acid ABC transporter permease [Cereibacter changlensis]